jgi:hypothetical protein
MCPLIMLWALYLGGQDRLLLQALPEDAKSRWARANSKLGVRGEEGESNE